MSITNEVELLFLQKRAQLVGMFVQRHRKADIYGGDLYLQEQRTPSNFKPPSLLRFATAEQIEDALAEIEAVRFKRA